MWDVYDVTDSDMIDMSLPRFQKMYLPTLDGGLIYIGISHSFNLEELQRAKEGKDWDYNDRYVKVVVV
jgi:hypothetical protein